MLTAASTSVRWALRNRSVALGASSYADLAARPRTTPSAASPARSWHPPDHGRGQRPVPQRRATADPQGPHRRRRHPSHPDQRRRPAHDAPARLVAGLYPTDHPTQTRTHDRTFPAEPQVEGRLRSGLGGQIPIRAQRPSWPGQYTRLSAESGASSHASHVRAPVRITPIWAASSTSTYIMPRMQNGRYVCSPVAELHTVPDQSAKEHHRG